MILRCPAGPPLAQADLDHVLDHTEGLWQGLRGERMLLTGGTGFFGKWMVETFLRANDILGLHAGLVILTRSPDHFAQSAPHLAQHECVTVLQGDVRTFAFPDGHFRHVIHAAADSVVPPCTPDEEQHMTIVEGTRRALNFAEQAGAENLLLVSSGAVYGPQPASVSHLQEDHLFAPTENVYALGKRAAEALCVDWPSDRLSRKIARCFAFVGPHLPLRAHFAIGNFIADALSGKDISISGDGTPRRSYLYAADLAIWLWTILLRGASGRAYNVGAEEAISIRVLAETTKAVIRPSLGVRVSQAAPRSGIAPSQYVPSTQRAQTELGLAATIGLEEAICRTAAWYQGTGI